MSKLHHRNTHLVTSPKENLMVSKYHSARWLLFALAPLAMGAALGGCIEDDSVINDEQRAALALMVLDDTTPLPPSPTNRFADDLAAAELGQAVFFDKRFITGAGNCRTCHDLTAGGADTKSRGPTTIFGTAALSRNTPTVFNIAFSPGINHWSGNFTAVWSVPSNVGTTTLTLAHFVFTDPYYRQAYEGVFGPLPDLSDTVRFPAVGSFGTPEWATMTVDDQREMGRFATNIGKAYEAYQRNLIDRNSPFDNFMNGDETALSVAAIRGAKLFVGRAGCNECHNGPAFSDFKFHNVGVPQGGAAPKKDFGFAGAGAFQSTYPFNANGEFSDDPTYGAAIAGDILPVLSADLPTLCSGPDPIAACGAFKTARLRSVGLTAPYFHTGNFDSLWDVVRFYNDATGSDNFVGARDAAIQPLYLNDDEMADLVAFLQSLTGAPVPSQWANCPTSRIPTEACMAP
jgi:cytochrome c peroxidase